jgi:hypothetical protein
MEEVQVHPTSLAVWDIGNPIEAGTAFNVKIGAKCHDGCNLAGCHVMVLDTQDKVMATGILSDDVYSDTVRLYWVEVELSAPDVPGQHIWKVLLPEMTENTAVPESESSQTPSHAAASASFSLNVVNAADNELTIVTVDKDSQQPVANAHVMLRPYSGYTDSDGLLRLRVSKGSYRLCITVNRYENYFEVIDVNDSRSITVGVEPSEYTEDYRGNICRVRKQKQLL